MTDVAVDTLRLRGPGAARLTRVAATGLPAALDRALSDVGDVTVDRIVVTLDLDVEEYDDETLAILWADAIRARVLAVRGQAVAPRPQHPTVIGVAASPLRSTASVWSAARTWLAAGAEAVALPPALLALGDPAIARAVAAAAGPADWSRLVHTLDRVLGAAPADPRSVDGLDRFPTVPDPSEPGPAEGAVLPQPEPGPTSLPDPARAAGDRPPQSSAEARVLERLGVLAELADGRPEGAELATLTRAAGLVLVYPWLADHCRRAEDLHPGLDPVDVREAALAAVAGPDDPTLADDPLVALLAGRWDRPPAQRPDRVPLPRQVEVVESAVDVLRSFAALLPGFETSTPQFVRECWIVRTGLVDTDRDPVQLTATTHPLDVLLPLLPYPVGLVKLPWSPPVSVRFRP